MRILPARLKRRDGDQKGSMKVFLWLAFLVAMGMAIFAVQNSSAPPVMIKFLVWEFETSLDYTLLGAIGSGMLIMLFLWVRSALSASFRIRNLEKEAKALKARQSNETERQSSGAEKDNPAG